MKPAPVNPATNNTYGFGTLVELLLAGITLGSVDDGVEGSAKSMEKIIKKLISTLKFHLIFD